MRRVNLLFANCRYFARVNCAVLLGVITAGAVLTGALLVGDAMRSSLRTLAVGRLGRIDYALIGNRYFRAALADELAGAPLDPPLAVVAPVISVRGAVVNAATGARRQHAAILGVDDRFWSLGAESGQANSAVPAAGTLLVPTMTGRIVVLNAVLAEELSLSIGDDVLLRIGQPADISTETLLGRRDDTTVTLRLSVAAITPADGLGAFSYRPSQVTPRNAFVPLATLQRALDRRDRVSALLIAEEDPPSPRRADRVAATATHLLTLADAGLSIRTSAKHGYVALESDEFLVAPDLESAARAAATEVNAVADPVLAYLAQSIGRSGRDETIPYSIVAAIEPGGPIAGAVELTAGDRLRGPGEVWLNAWAAADLAAGPGDEVELVFEVTDAFGQLRPRRQTLRCAGIVALAGMAADPGFTPPYPGVTDVDNIGDWDPPFPMDLRRIRDRDETYWDEQRTTPKAFVTLADGQAWWSTDGDRHGRITALRLFPAGSDGDVGALSDAFTAALRARLDLSSARIAFEPVRAIADSAGRGSTDFGGLFIGFSFFLIAAALMLVALLFRLGIERRAAQIGLLRATGFTPRQVARLFIAEGALVAGVGSLLGALLAGGYARLMLRGLRTWWSAAANAPFLQPATGSLSYLIGIAATFLLAVLSIAWTLRGLRRHAPQALLAGVMQSGGSVVPRSRRFPIVTVLAFAAGIAVAVAAGLGKMQAAGGFFASGALMLIAGCGALATWLRHPPREPINPAAAAPLFRLGLRNAPRNAQRSLLTAALIASASFLIIALQAFRLEPETDTTDRHAGAGGFTLYAEAATPLLADLNDAAGQSTLNLSVATRDQLTATTVYPFRLRPGEETSCLSLYRPQQPRILGVPAAFIERGGFRFSAVDGASADGGVVTNPWSLLDATFPDGAIPVIGDEAAVKWQVHSGLGQDLVIRDGRGADVRLRFVALLQGSALQSEFLVSEAAFKRLFPAIDGYAFFLIDTPGPDTPGADTSALTAGLEQDLADHAVDVRRVRDRLSDYLAVQNTYLTTFQQLGGLGLILGSIGLAAVLLRNVWERRRELAVMAAVGYSRAQIGGLLFVENGLLVVVGLLIGSISALLAVLPQILTVGQALPWLSVAIILLGVIVVGIGASGLALLTVLRGSPLAGLHAD